MNAERYSRIREIFLKVREEPAARVDIALERLCGDDSGLRAEVQSLLGHTTPPEGFLESPILGEQILGRAPLSDSPAAAELPSGAARIPEQIGLYRVTRLLGEGGMGSVFEAEQIEPIRRTVALKVVRHGMYSREVVARFALERQALARMNHPGIARVLDAGETPEGRPFFVMDYVHGEPITRFAQARRLPLRPRLKLFVDLCDAVQHAHQRGILHRDLKPTNILVTEDNAILRPVVIDFGLAKLLEPALDAESAHTLAGRLIGTPEYMSPEQAEAAAAGVDTRADVYALGAVLYELMTDRPPHAPERLRAAGFAELQRILREEEPVPPGRVCGGFENAVRGELEWIVARAMQKRPDDRYPSAAALREDVQRYLDGAAVIAGPPSVTYRMRKLIRRYRGAFLAGAVALAALLTGLVLAISGFVSATRAKEAKSIALARSEDSARAAHAEVERSNAMNQFFAEILNSGSPGYPGGKLGRTVAEALTTASRKLDEGELCDDLSAQFVVRLTLGRAFLGLGYLDEARREAEWAARLAHDLYPDGSADLGSALDLLGAVASEQSDFAFALPTLREAHSMLEQYRGSQHKDTINVLISLGTLNMLMGNYADSLSRFESAVQAAGPLAATEPELLVSAVVAYSQLLYVRGDFARADTLLREAETRIDEARLVETPKHAEFLARRSQVARALGRLPEALDFAQRALAERRARLGQQHFDVARSLIDLGAVYEESNELDAAEATYREALDVTRSAVGRESHLYSVALADFSLVLVKQGELIEAEQLIRESLELARRLHGRLRVDDAHSLTTLVKIALKDRTRSEESEALARQALALWQQGMDPDSLYVIEAKYYIAMARGQRCREHPDVMPECETLLLECWNTLQKGIPNGENWPPAIAKMLFSMYELWDQLEPSDERKRLAAEWRQRHAALLPSAQPTPP